MAKDFCGAGTLRAVVLRVVTDLQQLPANWDRMLRQQDAPSPFMSRAYLQRLQASGSAVAGAGWSARFVLVEVGAELRAAAPLWVKPIPGASTCSTRPGRAPTRSMGCATTPTGASVSGLRGHGASGS